MELHMIGLSLFWNEPLYLGITKRCRLSWLTNSALVYEPKRGRGWRGLSQWVQPTSPSLLSEYSCVHGAQINFGDLTSYWTYALNVCNLDKLCLVFWRALLFPDWCWIKTSAVESGVRLKPQKQKVRETILWATYLVLRVETPVLCPKVQSARWNWAKDTSSSIDTGFGCHL